MNYNYDATLLYFLFSNISILRMYLYHHYSNICVPSLHTPSSLTMRSLRRYYLMKRKQSSRWSFTYHCTSDHTGTGILCLSSSRQYIIRPLYSVASLFLSIFSLRFYDIGSFCIYHEGVLTFLYYSPLEGASIF
jgi:hypothetical protein